MSTLGTQIGVFISRLFILNRQKSKTLIRLKCV